MKTTRLMFSFVLLVLQLLYLLSYPGTLVWAQTNVSPTPVDYKLPFPGLLPDHRLYPLKKLRDKILYLLTPDPVKKIELSLLFADKKIGMAQNLAEKGNVSLSVEFLLESQNDLLNGASQLESLSAKNILPVGLPDKIELAAKKHREIINSLIPLIHSKSETLLAEQALELNNQANMKAASIKDKS